MSGACVLDASVVARFWFREDDIELADAAATFLAASAAGRISLHAPDLMLYEVGNVLWKVARFNGWPPAAARRATAQLTEIGFELHRAGGDLEAALDIGLEHGVTLYDATYVALARRLEVPLYTADRRLVRSVQREYPEVRLLTA